MNADLLKIRKSRFFKNLPDRVFNRITSQMKVRAYSAGEPAFKLESNGEFARYYGYVVSGRILFLSADKKPLGVAIKDEFVLGRPFSLNDTPVAELISAQEGTFIVFIPKEVVALLAGANDQFAEMIEEIYESIFERARIIAADVSAFKKIQDWIQHTGADKTLSSWIGTVEKKRIEAAQKKRRDERNRLIIGTSWAVALFAVIVAIYYSYSHIKGYLPGEFKAGSDFNVNLGIIGFILIICTNVHTLSVWCIRKFKWKINFQVSQQYHILFGIIGASFILLHSAFQLKGLNVAHFAIYTMGIGLLSGFVGQFISNQIPKTIRGEKIKLESLKAEQKKLQQKAELLMEGEGMYKTSVALISHGIPMSFWGNFLAAPKLWLRSIKLKKALRDLGLSHQSAAVAADLVLHEFRLRQKVRFLEISNIFFKKWMFVHKPFGYLVYILAIAHVLLVTVFA